MRYLSSVVERTAEEDALCGMLACSRIIERGGGIKYKESRVSLKE